MSKKSKLPHQRQRSSPEQVYAWYERDLQRRKIGRLRIHPDSGKRCAIDGKVFIRFPTGELRETGEVLTPEPAKIPSLSDVRLDRESRLNLRQK